MANSIYLVILATLVLCPERVLVTPACNTNTEVCVNPSDQSLIFPQPSNTETEVKVKTEADYGSLNGYLKGIVAGFFDFVFPAGIPWGDVGAALQTFAGNNPNSTEGKGDAGQLGQEFIQFGAAMVMFFLIGILGILFLVVFPIVCCCMCCCRCCCNNCGAKKIQKNSSNCCFIVLLVGTSFTVTFILIGGSLLCATHVQFTKDVPKQPFDMTSNTVSTATDWIVNILNDMFDAAAVPFNGTIDIQINELGSAGAQIWAPLQTGIETALQPPSTDLDTAIAEYNAASDSMTIYYENTFYGQSTEPQNMKEISLLLESIRASLAADGTCSGNEACTNATSEIAKHVINDAVFAAAASYSDPPITTGFSQSTLFGDVISRAGTEVETSIQEQIDNFTVVMDEQRTVLLDSLEEAKDGLVESVENSGLNDFDLENLQKQADTYAWARDILSALFFFPTLLVFLFAVVGIVLGLIGYDKYAESHERSRISNIGGNLVCCSSVLSFLFVWSYMFWFVMPFLFLAFPQRICSDIQSDTITKELLDRPYMIDGKNKYYFASVVLGDGNVELTFSGILDDCSAGATFWQAFKITESGKYDISSNLNSDEIIGDTSTLFSDVSNFDFATFKLLDGGLKNDVDDITANVAFYESGIDDFKTLMANNVGLYESQLTNSQTTAPTAVMSTPCDTAMDCKSLTDIYSDISTSGVSSPNITQALNDLQTAINNVAVMKSDYDNFNTSADDAKNALPVVSTAAANLTMAASTVETDLQMNGPGKMLSSSTDLALKLKDWFDEMFQFIAQSFEEKVGECGTFTALYRAFFANTCDYFLLEVSGLYFSSGIIAISMFGNLIWATKLAKYLRKMEDPYASDENDEIFENRPERNTAANSNTPLDNPHPFGPAEGFQTESPTGPSSDPEWSVRRSWEP